jgi:hypothetical protein
MTEGKCEKAMMDVLIDKGILKFTRFDLLYEEIYNLRQIRGEVLQKINQLPINETVKICRIGDKLSDKLKIPKDISWRVTETEDYCTKPELEILNIIYLDLYKDYEKLKSTTKPSEFLKEICPDYKKSYKYHYDFYTKLSDSDITNLFHEYNGIRSGTHKKNQKLLSGMIK